MQMMFFELRGCTQHGKRLANKGIGEMISLGHTTFNIMSYKQIGGSFFSNMSS